VRRLETKDDRRFRGIWLPWLAIGTAAVFISCGGQSDEATPLALFDIATQEVGPDRIVVVWATSVPSDGEVRYGTSRGSLDRGVPVRSVATSHRASIAGLNEGTTYYYQVVARSAAGEEVASPVFEVATGRAGRTGISTTPQRDAGYDVGTITTRFGEIVIRFYEDEAPRHAENFKNLARKGFYDGTTFHRVIPTFIIQGGDPLSKDEDRSNDGSGGPGYTLPAEIYHPHRRGSVAAARSPDEVNPERRSSGSQFYICVAPVPQLDGQYTVFAEVVRGMVVVDRIAGVPTDENDNPITPIPMEVTIQRVASDEEP